MLTRNNLIDAITHVRKLVNVWEASDGPLVRWRTGDRKPITEGLIEAFDDLFALVGVAEVADDAKKIVLAIDQFDDLLAEWAEGCELSPEDTDPHGSQKLWMAFDAIFEACEVPQRRKPESIKQLGIEKVSDGQIALIYGWKNRDGSPDVQKVREERDNPGTHYDAETWIHPADLRAQNEINELWTKRAPRMVVNESTGGQREAPESLDELIQQRVPSKQIAMMKRIDVEQVRLRASQLGIPLDGQFVPSISPADRMQSMRDEESDREAQVMAAMNEQPKTLPERVMALAQSGQSMQQIVDGLKKDYPNLTPAKLEKMLRAQTVEASSI
jgi:hypothetical protein